MQQLFCLPPEIVKNIDTIDTNLSNLHALLGLSERAKERSAFCTRRGLFHFTRMPFGLSGAPGSFCRLMSIVLRDLLWVVCLCYLDDIIIYGRTPEELLERLQMVLDKLRDAGLKLKPSKCVLFKTEIQYLGHLVSADGVNPIPDKIQALKRLVNSTLHSLSLA